MEHLRYLQRRIKKLSHRGIHEQQPTIPPHRSPALLRRRNSLLPFRRREDTTVVSETSITSDSLGTDGRPRIPIFFDFEREDDRYTEDLHAQTATLPVPSTLLSQHTGSNPASTNTLSHSIPATPQLTPVPRLKRKKSSMLFWRTGAAHSPGADISNTPERLILPSLGFDPLGGTWAKELDASLLPSLLPSPEPPASSSAVEQVTASIQSSGQSSIRDRDAVSPSAREHETTVCGMVPAFDTGLDPEWVTALQLFAGEHARDVVEQLAFGTRLDEQCCEDQVMESSDVETLAHVSGVTSNAPRDGVIRASHDSGAAMSAIETENRKEEAQDLHQHPCNTNVEQAIVRNSSETLRAYAGRETDYSTVICRQRAGAPLLSQQFVESSADNTARTSDSTRDNATLVCRLPLGGVTTRQPQHSTTTAYRQVTPTYQTVIRRSPMRQAPHPDTISHSNHRSGPRLCRGPSLAAPQAILPAHVREEGDFGLYRVARRRRGPSTQHPSIVSFFHPANRPQQHEQEDWQHPWLPLSVIQASTDADPTVTADATGADSGFLHENDDDDEDNESIDLSPAEATQDFCSSVPAASTPAISPVFFRSQESFANAQVLLRGVDTRHRHLSRLARNRTRSLCSVKARTDRETQVRQHRFRSPLGRRRSEPNLPLSRLLSRSSDDQSSIHEPPTLAILRERNDAYNGHPSSWWAWLGKMQSWVADVKDATALDQISTPSHPQVELMAKDQPEIGQPFHQRQGEPQHLAGQIRDAKERASPSVSPSVSTPSTPRKSRIPRPRTSLTHSPRTQPTVAVPSPVSPTTSGQTSMSPRSKHSVEQVPRQHQHSTNSMTALAGATAAVAMHRQRRQQDDSKHQIVHSHWRTAWSNPRSTSDQLRTRLNVGSKANLCEREVYTDDA